MSSVTVKVTGLKELGQAMNALGRKAKNRIAVKAMRRGGAIIRDRARANAPVLSQPSPYRKPGTLRKAISSRTKIDKNGRVNTYVWVKGLKTKQVLKFKDKTGKGGAYNPRDPFYWRFVEFGTSKMPAKPFMRPAFEQSKQQAAQTIINTLRDEIIAEAGK
ncbi:hypothetical protein A6J76_007395 [Aggregatibacter aphrophilus]|jgi:bacteriophage protein of unknown function (DUF646)|uniref:HK97-gp10 family putative phage morphogenesis protein n=1 Tax=Aggregatibacter aphrophilus TaxID=732 RepID=UPI0009F5A935|nr:HK97-gp10 family putative phage morphogenesis protein [Aggregatibacter aphrophilus]DAJ35329.1 MAG TPA: tail component [Caudoviricetes sp.]PNL88263.1 hypothetical protein A6J76_011575 [Aggregatibacter aphrophilus]PNL93772.1 hypothetical protein A6J76_007395 [Aggregatibacter aphrophilus]DAN05662.1 MAG TPA: tail component [Caudoviricetes sp.]DAN28461.1 MAG TPA: tail component [Caudoviricetes sp.]